MTRQRGKKVETDRAGPGALAHQGDVVRVPTWTSEVTSVIHRGRYEFAYDVYVLFKKFVKKKTGNPDVHN